MSTATPSARPGLEHRGPTFDPHADVTSGSRSVDGTSRGWAVAGLAAGIAGLVGVAASMRIDAVYDPATVGDPVRITDRLADQVPQILVFHTATMIGVVLTIVFAAGLTRRLRAQAPAQSLLPVVAGAGLGLVSVAGLIGAGLTTEFVFGLQDATNPVVPEVAVFFGHWVGTIPWLWVGAGLSGVALALAAVRHAAAPRWLGWVSLLLGGVTLLFGISPLQYMAGMVGPLWLTIAGLGFLLGDRRKA